MGSGFQVQKKKHRSKIQHLGMAQGRDGSDFALKTLKKTHIHTHFNTSDLKVLKDVIILNITIIYTLP